MSLNTVVNNLVRAAAGIPADISDDDLDRHVASLLAQEAKQRESKWSEMGLSAFLDRESNDAALPRPNKRFLASVIRTVDGHNAALLRDQAQAARNARLGRGESSRTGASRLFGGALQGMSRQSGGGGDRDRRREGDRRDRHDDRENQQRSRRYRDERDASPHRRDERDRDDRRRSRHHDEESEPRRREDRHDHRRRHRDDDDPREHRRSEQRSTISKRQRDPSPLTRKKTTPSPPPSTRPAPPPAPKYSPPPPRSPISKMDKYFSTSYDPRLDLGEIPKEGMIAAVGWDNMLAVLKERGQKRRHMSPGLSDDLPSVPKGVLIRSPSPDPIVRKKKEERRRRRGDSDSEDERERAKRKEKRRKDKEREKHLATPGQKSNGSTAGGAGALLEGYEYVRKGGVREWDVGK